MTEREDDRERRGDTEKDRKKRKEREKETVHIGIRYEKFVNRHFIYWAISRFRIFVGISEIGSFERDFMRVGPLVPKGVRYDLVRSSINSSAQEVR